MSRFPIGIDSRRSACAALPLLALGVALIYLPDIGHGFIRDDFMWIRIGHVDGVRDLPRLFTTNTGFYRPVVLASFAIDYALFGLRAFPYALTNLLLLFACAVMIIRLGRVLALAPAAAVFAAGAWMLNFHAISMSLLWLSGRTALLVTLFGLLTATDWLSARRWRAGAWCLLALLSKEEAVVLPFLLAAWTWHIGTRRGWSAIRDVVQRTWPMFAALAVYVVVRANSGAFGPINAPSYYQFTTSVPLLLRNIGEYLDRACTMSATGALTVWAVVRRRPVVTPIESRAFLFGALWLVGGFAITVFLPVRSDLYAVNPSVGATLAAAAVIQGFERTARVAVTRTLAVLAVVPFLLMPVYRQRNSRWVAPADLSRQVLADLQRQAALLPDRAHVVLVDAPDEPINLASAFGNLLPDATAVFVGRGITAELGNVPRRSDAIYRLRSAHLEPIAVP